MDTNKILIFGNGEISEIVTTYFLKENKYEIIGYVVDDDYLKEEFFLKKPVMPKSEFFKKFLSDNVMIHVALSYRNLNQNRYRIYNELKQLNYNFVSYVSDKIVCGENVKFGNNCFVQENQTIQDNVTIGNNVIIWAGNHIGHSSKIGDHTYISSHCVISGHVKIGKRCFVGVNSSFKDFIETGDDCIFGMCSKVMTNIKPNSVLVEEPSKIFDGDSRQAKFLRNKI